MMLICSAVALKEARNSVCPLTQSAVSSAAVSFSCGRPQMHARPLFSSSLYSTAGTSYGKLFKSVVEVFPCFVLPLLPLPHTHTHTHTHTHPVKKTRKETYFSHKLCAVLRVLCRSRFSTPFSGNIETDTAAGTRHGYGPTGTLMTANGPPHRRLVSHWTSAFCGPHGVITGRSPSARKRS